MYLQHSKYQVLSMIGQGSAHQVFKAEHNLTQQLFAIKIEKRPSSGQIQDEIKVLKELQEIEGVPKIINHGITPDNKCFFITPLLNCSLRDLVKSSPLSLSNILAIGLSIIQTLEKVHKKNILHLDIKPENIMISQGMQKYSKDQILMPGYIQLIDFGLSQSVRNSKFLKNVFFGSLNFASRASHKGQQLGYKDDLESLLFVLVYLRNGNLPWSLKPSMGFKNMDIKFIGEMKTSLFKSMELSIKFPLEFSKFISYIDGLKHNEMPDYSYIKELFINMLLFSMKDQSSSLQSINQLGNSKNLKIPVENQLLYDDSIETQIQEDIVDIEAKIISLSEMVRQYNTVQMKSIVNIEYY